MSDVHSMYRDKIAVVVGGAQGTGRACCESLVSKGAKVCIGDVVADAGRELETKLNHDLDSPVAKYQMCDVRDDGAIDELFKTALRTFGAVPQIVFNLAGKIQESDWATALDINIGGNIRCINYTMKYMSRVNGGPGGVYTCMASMVGLRGGAIYPVYCASKHAIVGLCRSWGTPEHLEPNGIRFNCVCPTTIDSGFLDQVRDAYFINETLEYLAKVDRLSPKDVAEGFLLSVEDVTMNGESIRVSKAHGIDLATFQNTPMQ